MHKTSYSPVFDQFLSFDHKIPICGFTTEISIDRKNQQIDHRVNLTSRRVWQVASLTRALLELRSQTAHVLADKDQTIAELQTRLSLFCMPPEVISPPPASPHPIPSLRPLAAGASFVMWLFSLESCHCRFVIAVIHRPNQRNFSVNGA